MVEETTFKLEVESTDFPKTISYVTEAKYVGLRGSKGPGLGWDLKLARTVNKAIAGKAHICSQAFLVRGHGPAVLSPKAPKPAHRRWCGPKVRPTQTVV